jgi:hypothetical protein
MVFYNLKKQIKTKYMQHTIILETNQNFNNLSFNLF